MTTATSSSEHINLLDLLTQDLTLPDGCDQWGIRSVHPDLRSSRGYRWPWPGQWAEAAGPFHADNTDGCPSDVGDGICLAHSWRGMRSGSIPAHTLLLCAYSQADVLGATEGEQKIRIRRALVVDVIDGARLVREHGTRANLTRANLTRANLTDANLARANLTDANLTDANLTDANLARANLARANLTRAYLTGAYLTGANLTRANLTGAVYTQLTRWPVGVNPAERGAIQLGV